MSEKTDSHAQAMYDHGKNQFTKKDEFLGLHYVQAHCSKLTVSQVSCHQICDLFQWALEQNKANSHQLRACTEDIFAKLTQLQN